MDIFIVHLLPEDLSNWAIEVPHGEGNIVQNYKAARQSSVEPFIEEIHQDVERKSVWYAGNEPAANALAALIAVHCPNRDIQIYKLQSVTRAPAAKPVRAVFTERGLVPE